MTSASSAAGPATGHHALDAIWSRGTIECLNETRSAGSSRRILSAAENPRSCTIARRVIAPIRALFRVDLQNLSRHGRLGQTDGVSCRG
jgi:hypothetical protein